jgi:hypothetical protein
MHDARFIHTRANLAMSLSFLPRTHFPFPTNTPSWFAGHMQKSLSKLPLVLKDIDLVIEARDARLPLTSINPAFEDVLTESWGLTSSAGPSGWKGKGKEKLVVYTKRDQAEERFEEVSVERCCERLSRPARRGRQTFSYDPYDFLSSSPNPLTNLDTPPSHSKERSRNTPTSPSFSPIPGTTRTSVRSSITR